MAEWCPGSVAPGDTLVRIGNNPDLMRGVLPVISGMTAPGCRAHHSRRDAGMYVCICNALNERSVREAVRRHRPSRVSDVYRCLGVTPICGKCAGRIRDLLVEEGTIPPRAVPFAPLPIAA